MTSPSPLGNVRVERPRSRPAPAGSPRRAGRCSRPAGRIGTLPRRVETAGPNLGEQREVETRSPRTPGPLRNEPFPATKRLVLRSSECGPQAPGPGVRPATEAEPAASPEPGAAIGHAALADLHARYRLRLEAAAFRVLRDRDEAEDVVQRVFEALPRVRFRGQASLWTYLYRAAINGAVSALRKRKRRDLAETELRVQACFSEPARDAVGNPEARVLEGEILSAVASALLDVKPQHRRALVLRIVWGLTNSEIAAREGIPLPTVGTWLRRGREELRARLGPLLRDLDLGEDAP